MSWSLYSRNNSEKEGENAGKKLEPLTFTNKKTQQDVVDEVMQGIKEGNKIIFIHGVCGSGKSAMALNIAKNFKKASIVVPIKSLQEQYEVDYTQKMYILKEDKRPLKISVIKGRNNFRCAYDAGERADNDNLPCTIEIREKNSAELFRYLGENPATEVEEFSGPSDIKRMNVAPACPYWAPIMPADINPKSLGEFEKVKYPTVSGKEYAVFLRKKGCPYIEQYLNYARSDVLIFNSTKYLIESTLGRKPKTDVEIIDECDEFLDSFANERKINVNRLVQALSKLAPKEQKSKNAIKELIQHLNNLVYEKQDEGDCKKVTRSKIEPIIELILEYPNLAEDEEFNYFSNVVEIARSFEEIIEDTYFSIEKIGEDKGQQSLFSYSKSEESQVYLTLVSINLASKFKELLEQNKTFVMMSGTLHTSEVLKDIFGLDDFKIIEAETKMPGEIEKGRLGLEKNCSYSSFKRGVVTRERYLKVLDHCIIRSEKPTLVHINAFSDLPTNEEKERLHLDNLISKERLYEMQKNAKQHISDFYNQKRDILFTTKCSRGMDFPGDKCKSVVMTRFPYPNISSLFWKILKKEQPDKFMEFYMDKARRELMQKIARGVRFTGDSVRLFSPDIRVLNQRMQ